MPQRNGAGYLPEEPDTPYYRAAGNRLAEPAPGVALRPDVPPPARRGATRAERRPVLDPDASAYQTASGRASGQPAGASRAGMSEPGLPAWAAVLVLLVIAGIAGLIDSLSGTTLRGVFNYGLVVASFVAILVVRRGHMFPVVIAPPLVYLAASAGIFYIRSGGSQNYRQHLLDAALNWVVYGFPAIAGATAAVLVVAGVRTLIRR